MGVRKKTVYPRCNEHINIRYEDCEYEFNKFTGPSETNRDDNFSRLTEYGRCFFRRFSRDVALTVILRKFETIIYRLGPGK